MKLLAPIEGKIASADEKQSAATDDWWTSIEDAFKMPPENSRKYGHKDGKIPVDLEAIARRALKKPHLPKLEPLAENVIIAAETFPGFSSDLTRWNLTIDEMGNLHQNIQISTPENRDAEPYSLDVEIGSVEVERLLKVAMELNFTRLNYSEGMMTDTGSEKISVRLSGELVSAIRNGYPLMTDESFERFRQLWQEIHLYAPFPRREN